jgi:branched-chain amino acid aminotransferase
MAEPERVAYYNGAIVPESMVRIPFRDSAAIRGVGVYDSARTFTGQPFKLREHLRRLWKSMAYVGIAVDISLDELEAISTDLAAQNYALLSQDVWITQRISQGAPKDLGGNGEPTVIVECLPLPFAARAVYFRDGVRLVTATTRRTPPWAVSAQAKTVDLLNFFLAEQEVRSRDPGAWPVLVDHDGCLTEGAGANVFVVRDGELLTPRARYVLPGITRSTVFELAQDYGFAVREADIGLFDAYTADEIFITSTSLCVCPVATINGRCPNDPRIPGPITRRLQDAFSDLVGIDVVEQYLRCLASPRSS